ncbi:phosphoribosyltransferase [Actinoplanes solisilvae]|uniref:phosphoribosyltransferase n=1 Tax=Actinoplanes solisilvae TaxID=2486853 RepID=UPI000FDC176A|nr:phosphoribosyltransferase family protein [Actinoplanes solisilvae]
MKDSGPAQVSYTWDQIEDQAATVLRLIRRDGTAPDVVISVLRGGAVPGVLLAHLLGGPAMYAVRASTMRDERPRVRKDRLLVQGMDGLPDLAGLSVLLVDDVVNTGKTLIETREQIMISRRPRALATACLVWDTVGPRGEVLAHCDADFYAERVHAWVRFPWELGS